MPIKNTKPSQNNKIKSNKAERLCSLVEMETKKLKEHATKKELRRLNLKRLAPSSTVSCIYGQMTGSCYSERAHELITKCAPKMYDGSLDDFKLNGKPTAGEERKRLTCARYSPIEIFIANCLPEDRQTIINFLKGKTESLELKTNKLKFYNYVDL